MKTEGPALTGPTNDFQPEDTKCSQDCLTELIESQPLAIRVAPALLALGLRRIITWDEGRFVLDAVEHFDEAGTRRSAWIRRLLGGT